MEHELSMFVLAIVVPSRSSRSSSSGSGNSSTVTSLAADWSPVVLGGVSIFPVWEVVASAFEELSAVPVESAIVALSCRFAIEICFLQLQVVIATPHANQLLDYAGNRRWRNWSLGYAAIIKPSSSSSWVYSCLSVQALFWLQKQCEVEVRLEMRSRNCTAGEVGSRGSWWKKYKYINVSNQRRGNRDDLSRGYL